jgi:hypothetical protein
MPLIQLDGKIANLREIRRMLGARTLTQIRKVALRDTANFWHEKILPKHFRPEAHYRYSHERRDPGYLRETKQEEGIGKGKTVDDVLTGQSERWMKVFFNITGSSIRATLTMRPPRYFTNPFIGSSTIPVTLPDGTVYMRPVTISRQPDKPKEITTRHPQDDREMTAYLQRDLQLLVNYYMGARASG